jgi:chloramphenicol-sensitive protein RarD
VTPEARSSRLAGVFFAAAAYLIWGLFPLYFHALGGVPALEVLCHRIVWSALFMTALVTVLRRWGDVVRQLRVPGTLRVLSASAALISTNWLVYIWAVNAGRVLEASLGYFVQPLLSVVLGVVFLKEPLSKRQKVAVGSAAAGVLVLVVRAGIFPWVALVLALSFGFYGLLRKRARVDSVSGLLVEVVVLLPLAALYLGWLGFSGASHFGGGTRWTALLAASGVVTAVPLILFGVGVRRLRLATIGLLQYLNPTTQFLLAVFLFGEALTSAHLVAFGCIWGSLALYTSETLKER